MNRRTVLAIALLSVLYSASAHAGRNANGALIVHTNDAIIYNPRTSYCGSGYDDPGTCEDAGTRTDHPLEDSYAVVWFIAAFPDDSAPAVTTVQFGIRHNLPSPDYCPYWNFCGPFPHELPDENWPFGDGHCAGNVITFYRPVFDNLFPIYWFAPIGSLPNSYVGTFWYPTTGEAKFVDDSQPPVEDLCERFGLVRWGAPGYNECPGEPLSPACCFSDSTCMTLPEEDCIDLGGDPLGPGTSCHPNPCILPLTGACCFPTGDCQILTEPECLDLGGAPQGEGTSCDPNPCVPTGMERTTWGRIRAGYR